MFPAFFAVMVRMRQPGGRITGLTGVALHHMSSFSATACLYDLCVYTRQTSPVWFLGYMLDTGAPSSHSTRMQPQNPSMPPPTRDQVYRGILKKLCPVVSAGFRFKTWCSGLSYVWHEQCVRETVAMPAGTTRQISVSKFRAEHRSPAQNTSEEEG